VVVNDLRNDEGIGPGRPAPAKITPRDGRVATEAGSRRGLSPRLALASLRARIRGRSPARAHDPGHRPEHGVRAEKGSQCVGLLRPERRLWRVL
jgi:hypothetical protein